MQKIVLFSFLFLFLGLPSAIHAQMPQPVGNPPGPWSLVFSDEFNATSLNTNIWEPSWFGGNAISNPINSDEDGCYDPAQVSMSNGTLKLSAVTTTKTNCRKRDGSQAGYASGLINSRNSVSSGRPGYQTAYGYFEARMFLPGSNGDIWNWPAFWTDGTGTWPTTGEIDIMEGLSSHEPCWHYHYQDSSGNHQGPGGCAAMDGTGWHVYAAHWEPGKITYYYDGVQVGVITQGVVSAPHFIILNNGINDRYGINVPATVEVDYVRVWKQQAVPTPTPPPYAIMIDLKAPTIDTIVGKTTNLSALLYTTTTSGFVLNPIWTGVTYDWGISSTGSIGRMSPTNRNITSFYATGAGTGDLFVTARYNGQTITKSVAVSVAPATSCVNKSKGDVSCDNKVTLQDLSSLLAVFGQTNASSDVNGDGRVSLADLSTLLSNFGKSY